MAVYTPVSFGEIAEFLQQYPLGSLHSAEGILAGVENTNYRLAVSENHGVQRYILTLFEKRVRSEDLPFFMALMRHVHAGGVICPLPVLTKTGEAILPLKGRPAAITSFLEGASVEGNAIQAVHTSQVGDWLATLHLAVRDFAGERANALALPGWQALYGKIGRRLEQFSPGMADRVKAELEFLSAQWPKDLPQGVIHADLFPDNVFFTNDTLSGVIDFYFACTDALFYDVAIAVNAWCFSEEGIFQPAHARAMLDAYQAKRPLSAVERAAFPLLLRGAALRFLLTRAHDALFPVEGAEVKVKDPMEYANKLRFFQEQGWVI